MNRNEAAAVISKVVAYERFSMSMEQLQVMAAAWAQSIRADVDVRWALDFVAYWYGVNNSRLMPADINQAWRAYCNERHDKAVLQAIKGGEPVPMPAQIRAQLDRLLQRRNEEDQA